MFGAGAISGCAQVKKQPSGGSEEQRCLGLVGFRLRGRPLCESFPIDERIFENAGLVVRVAKSERIELEKKAQLRLGWRAYPPPEPAQEVR